jgi:hypothetical protein
MITYLTQRTDRIHGYEYAVDIGGDLVTHTSALRAPGTTDPSPFSIRRATLADIPTLEQLVCVPRARAEIFVPISATALPSRLRWLLGDRPPAFLGPSYPSSTFFLLEKRETAEAPPRVVAAVGVVDNATAAAAGLLQGSAPSATVQSLLWDGVEDSSAVTAAIVRELRSELDTKLAPAK